MKAILVVTDSDAVPAFERAFLGANRGFSVVPGLIGKGHTGLKAGDRVHPGGSSLIFTVVPEADVAETFDLVRRVREEAGYAEATRAWSFTVEEVA
jgi:hypothetical protein